MVFGGTKVDFLIGVSVSFFMVTRCGWAFGFSEMISRQTYLTCSHFYNTRKEERRGIGSCVALSKRVRGPLQVWAIGIPRCCTNKKGPGDCCTHQSKIPKIHTNKKLWMAP